MNLIYLEDYLDYLNGVWVENGAIAAGLTPIKLATYDRSPIASMSAYAANVQAQGLDECLTDRQVALARKIVEKYRRQLLARGITLPSNINELPLRYKIRLIDRRKQLTYDSDARKLNLFFPYDAQKISKMKELENGSFGEVTWLKQNRVWQLDYTEGNLCALLNIFQDDSDLIIDDELEPVVKEILTASKKDLPTLDLENNKLIFKNCVPYVQDYFTQHNFDLTNLDHLPLLVSYAKKLELEIGDELFLELDKRYGLPIAEYLSNSIITLPTNNSATGVWVEYIKKLNQLLPTVHWILKLNYWDTRVNWQELQNYSFIKVKKNSILNLDKSLDLSKLTNSIIIADSIVAPGINMAFFEQHALKTIYVSDIGKLE